MREMGVFGLSIPEEYGGSSPDGHENTPMMIAVTEALSEASLAAAGSLITRPEILARALIAGGTEEQKAALAAEARRGRSAVRDRDHRARLRLGRREPVAQGHAHRRRLAAQRREDVVHVRRQGRRADGGHAHQPGPLARPSRPEPAAGREAVVRRARVHLRAGGGGKLIGRAIPTIGYRGMHSFDLAFENFFVPDANVIGGEAGLGKGFYLDDGRHGRRPHPDGGARAAA